MSHEIFDFWLFFHEILSPAPEQWVSHWGRYELFTKIHVDNRNFVFITAWRQFTSWVENTNHEWMYLQSIKSVKRNAARSIINRSILKKSRRIGFSVFIVHSSMVKGQKGSSRLLMGMGKIDIAQKNLKLKISCKTSFKNLWDWRRTGTDFSPHYLNSPLESRRYICGSCREERICNWLNFNLIALAMWSRTVYQRIWRVT